MDVKFWTLVFVIQLPLVLTKKEQNVVKHAHNRAPEDLINRQERLAGFSRREHDYLLPPIFSHKEPHDSDDEVEDDEIYDDEYEVREANYKYVPNSPPGHTSSSSTAVEIPRHTTKDSLPVFLLEPENTYVVKNKPANLKCRAANALKVFFKCNGVETETLNFEFVDPQTGVRIIEGECQVTRENVEEYFGKNKYQCTCIAWSSLGQIKSQPATIEVAYIKKHFSVAPKSQIVKQYSSVTLICEPPPAAPFVNIFWLKNGAPIVLNDNVQITREENLFIKQASLLDMANYTCVAENLAGKRMSEPALLTVFVNGGWITWSAWTDCNCFDETGRPVGRKRERTCTAPRPLNGGQPCMGSNIQKSPECTQCELMSRWSQWSDWSPCDSDCLRTRRRKCLNVACRGGDQQEAQCPHCVRTAKYIHGGSTYWSPILIIFATASVLCIIMVVIAFTYMKVRMSHSSPFVKAPTGSNYIGQVLRRTLTNQPDLTIHEEFQSIDPFKPNKYVDITRRQEHFYEVPVSSSYMAPIDQEVRTEMRKNEKNDALDIKQSDKLFDSSSFSSYPSTYENMTHLKSSPAREYPTSFESRFSFATLERTISKLLSVDGDWLHIKGCGVSLFIPEGSIDHGEQMFTISVANDDWNGPSLQEGETQLSPVIRCGPKNFHFLKSVVLSFPHYASMENASWLLSILQRPDDVNTEWRKVLTLGQETHGTPLFAQVDPSKVYLVSEFLNDFVLVGKSFSGLDAKLFKVALFISKQMDDMYYSLKVYILHDTPSAFYECFNSEYRCGGTMLGEPKIIKFQVNCSDLCVNLNNIGEGWTIHSGGQYQEMKYSILWNMALESMHCVYVLQQSDATNCLELSLCIYQKQNQSNFVNFNVTANNLNTNMLHMFKRLSTNTINLLENPYNYSSTSQKECNYEYIYRSNNYYSKSNISVDNNYRSNILTNTDRKILCNLLDPITAEGTDWRLLAEKLNICSYFYYFSRTRSPTENLLNLWLCRNNNPNMLVDLARVFREMGRIDCATVVERRCFTKQETVNFV